METWPESWQMAILGDHLELIRNGLTKTQSKEGRGYLVTRIETIAGDKINPEKVGYVDSVTPSEVERFRLQPGDILFSHINSEPQIGRSVLYEGSPGTLLHGMNLLCLRTKPSLYSHFLNYVFAYYRAIGYFIGISARAVNQNSINQGKLKSVQIPFPPLLEQRTIAHVLRTVQQAKEATEKVIAATRQLKQSLMRHLFTYGSVPSDQADQVVLMETDIGQIPSRWKVVPLGEGFSVFSGFAFKSQDFTNEGTPVIKIGNLQGGTVIIDMNTSYYPRHLSSSALEKFVLHAGDVLIAMTGATTGKVSTVPPSLEGVLLNQRVGKITKRDEGILLLEFAKRFISTKFFQAEIQENILKSAQGNISPKSIERILMPKPPLDEQRQIAAQLAAVDTKLVAEETRRDVLDALFQSLLHHLMTGKVRVHDLDLSSMKEDAP